MGTRDLLFVGLLVGGVAALGAGLYPPRVRPDVGRNRRPVAVDPSLSEATRAVDEAFRKSWAAAGVEPVESASELAVIRRLNLALTGSIPSLEEIRRVEAIREGCQTAAWADRLLADRRTAEYLAERLARPLVGTEGGPFIVFRRMRFVTWLADQIQAGRRYDEIVAEVIASDGLWTDRPATNFVTVTYDPEKKVVDPERLAGRVSRAFLGARIDCAQCHDHPFAAWKQHDFQGLAAFFGKTVSGFTGIHEGKTEWLPVDRKTGKPKEVEPSVPFHPELLPEHGPRRPRLAAWVTNPKNPALPRATVNRVWNLLFGRPLVEPVDDIVGAEEVPKALELLADDFVAHGYDLKRLIRVIVASDVFHLDSAGSPETTPAQEKAWAVFPLTPLRPEQIAGSISQSASLTTRDGDSAFISRLAKFLGETGFVNRYGDFGEAELDPHSATIPQRLLLMNGELVRDMTKPDFLHAAARIGWYAPTDPAAVEVAYLTVLTRRPTAEESAHFESALAGTRGDARSRLMSDLVWTLVNATEFSWNH